MRTRSSRGLLLAASMALGASAAAPAADLLDVYRMALESDPQFAAAQAGNRAAQESRPQARAGLLPNLSLDGDTFYNDQRLKRPEAVAGRSRSADYNSYGYSLSLVQPVFRWDRWIQLGQADSRVSQANAELDAAAQDLIVRSAERYFDVLAAIDNLEFATTTKEAFSQQLNQAEQRFEVGLIAITDVEEAKAGRDLAVTEEIRAKNRLENAYEALRELVGEDIRDLALLKEEVPLLRPDPDDTDRWTRTALDQNRQLAAATFAAKIAQDEIKRRQAGHYPTVDLVAARDYQSQSDSVSFGENDSYLDSIGVQLNLPLYQGGLVSSQTEQARHEYQQALEELEATRRGTYRQTRESFLGVSDSISGVNALRQALTSTQKALEAIEAGFQVGTRTSVDVLNAQRNTYESVRDYKNAQYGYILSTLRLKQAAGTLAPEDLVPVNGWLAH